MIAEKFRLRGIKSPGERAVEKMTTAAGEDGFMAIHGAARTKQGKDRRTNEDAFGFFPELPREH